MEPEPGGGLECAVAPVATGVGEPPSLSGELGETWEPGEGWERAGEGDEEREMKRVMASA